MISLSSPTERALRSRFQELLQVSPHLREAERAARRAEGPLWWGVLVFVCAVLSIPIAGAIVAVIAWILHESAGAVLVLSLAGYLTTAFMFGIADWIHRELRTSREITPLSCLPASDQFMARKVWNRLLLESLWGAPVLGVIYGVVAFENQLNLWGWVIALLLAPLQWSFALAAGTWLALSFPRWPHRWISYLLFASILAPICVPAFPWVNAAAWTLIAAPGSWPGTCLWEGYMNGNPLGWCPLVAVAAATIALPGLRGRLSNAYAVREFIRSDGKSYPIVIGPLDRRRRRRWRWPWRFARDEPQRTFATHAEAIHWIRNHDASRADWTSAGWMERLITSCLSPRQRAIVGAYQGDKPGWSDIWMAHLSSLLGMLLISPLVFRFRWQAAAPVTGCLFLYVLLAEASQSWRLTRSGACHPVAMFPASAREASRALRRVGIIRSLLHSLIMLPPLVAAYGARGCVATLIFFAGIDLVIGLLPHAELASKWSMSSFWARVKTVVVRGLIHIVGALGLFAAVGFCATGQLLWAAAGVVVALACGYLSRLQCVWLIDSGRVDLVKAG